MVIPMAHEPMKVLPSTQMTFGIGSYLPSVENNGPRMFYVLWLQRRKFKARVNTVKVLRRKRWEGKKYKCRVSLLEGHSIFLSYKCKVVMEEHMNPLAMTHLLQQTLRSLYSHEDSQWVYAVFWRILPRNYPPPKWDIQGGAYDRSRGNRRNWILAWEDGSCNFSASTSSDVDSGDYQGEFQHLNGLTPEVFFKMAPEIYNYGEGLIGKVAADHSHKWIYKETGEQEINFLTAWNNTADSHPRTWEAQFQSGIKTIALIAVREGVVQLGAFNKVMEDLNYIVLLRKKFHYLESIPGVFLPHPSSTAYPFKPDHAPTTYPYPYSYHQNLTPSPPMEYYNFNQITPSMSSLEALLSKLPSVVPTTSPSSSYCEPTQHFLSSQRPLELMGMSNGTKEEIDDEYGLEGESGSSMSLYRHHQQQQQHYQINVNNGRSNKGF